MHNVYIFSKTCRNLSQIGKVIPPLDSHRKVSKLYLKEALATILTKKLYVLEIGK